MADFQYKALTSSGVIVTGVLAAPSQAEAIQQIRNLGHYPISATDRTVSRWRDIVGADIFAAPRRVSTRSLALVTLELATLLKAGLELDRALGILRDLDDVRSLRLTLDAVRGGVRDGASFSDALTATRVFPKLYVNLVRAGEMGGRLEVTLRQLAEYLERTTAVREKIISALIYPAVLLVTAGISIVVILVFVLPQFTPLFAEAGKSLPLSTRIVMGAGAFVAFYGWLMIIAATAGVALFRHSLKTQAFRRRWDAFLLRMPLLGPLLTKMETERFSRTLGTLLANGVALPSALVITSETLTNSTIAWAVAETATSIKEGEHLTQHLRRSTIFPAIALDFIRIGEETGQLDTMLLRQADLYEREVKHTIDRLMAMLVPALTILMGVIVAGLIGSLLTAILSINDLAF